MKIAGLVAEYNPFHNGHLAHIEATKAALGPDTGIICCMSGDFVQRGEAAQWSKTARAECAVRCGADVVFELPVQWSLSSAEGFARGAVGLLDSLGVVDYLSFGSESPTAAPLERAAEALLDPAVDAAIRAELPSGDSYAVIRQRVLERFMGEGARVIETPNNILAVEYIKAIYERGSRMEPLATERRGAQHDKPASGRIRSASELRSMTAAGKPIAPYMPREAHAVLEREREQGRGPVLMGALETAVLSRLRMLGKADFAAIPDAAEGLENRLAAAMEEPTLDGVLAAAKSKRYALARLRRMCMCAALGIRAGMNELSPPYARLLAVGPNGRELLRMIEGRARVPVITKSAMGRKLTREARECFELNARARDLFVLGCPAAGERRGGGRLAAYARNIGLNVLEIPRPADSRRGIRLPLALLHNKASQSYQHFFCFI